MAKYSWNEKVKFRPAAARAQNHWSALLYFASDNRLFVQYWFWIHTSCQEDRNHFDHEHLRVPWPGFLKRSIIGRTWIVVVVVWLIFLSKLLFTFLEHFLTKFFIVGDLFKTFSTIAMLAEYETDDNDHSDPLTSQLNQNSDKNGTDTNKDVKPQPKTDDLVEQSLDDDPKNLNNENLYRNVSFFQFWLILYEFLRIEPKVFPLTSTWMDSWMSTFQMHFQNVTKLVFFGLCNFCLFF